MVEMARTQLLRPSVRARYPKSGDPLVRGTAKEFVQVVRDCLLTKSIVGEVLFLADQVMTIFPAGAGPDLGISNGPVHIVVQE